MGGPMLLRNMSYVHMLHQYDMPSNFINTNTNTNTNSLAGFP